MKRTILTLITIATVLSSCQSVDDLKYKRIASVKESPYLTEPQKKEFILSYETCQDKDCLAEVYDKFLDKSADIAVQRKLNPQSSDMQTAEPNTWEFSHLVDEMTGDSIHVASLKSKNYVTLDFPYNGKTFGSLYIRNNGGNDDVMFVIDQGQYTSNYKVDSWMIKFDDNDPVKYRILEPESGSSETLFISPEDSFIEKLNVSDSVKIQVSFYEYGNHTYTFNLKDLNWND